MTLSKLRAFNWDCDEVADGHDFSQLLPIKDSSTDRPRAILLHTVKGKGIPEFEHDPAWHARKIKEDELEIGNELGHFMRRRLGRILATSRHRSANLCYLW